VINEVMYDPIENEYYNEWIELYNPSNHSINISGWTITDNRYEDFLEGNSDNGTGSSIIPPGGYAIITDHETKVYENYNISNETIALYVDDKSIGNGLGNTGDMLILKNSTDHIIDYVEWIKNYTEIPGEPIDKITEGYSLSKIIQEKTNNSKNDYYEGLFTPGRKNILLERGKTKINNKKTEFLISKNELLEINLEIQNLGDFKDNITIKVTEITNGFNVKIPKKNIILNPNEIGNTILKVKPCNFCYKGTIKIIAESEKMINESDEIEFDFKINSPDLWIKKIKAYNENKNETDTINQGEIIRVKAFLKNLGIKNAYTVIVTFYIDNIKPENLIGTKSYESVSKYQKYPSILFDTICLKAGIHKIIVVADEKNVIEEICEDNNRLVSQIEIVDTRPDFFEKNIVISDFYYHAHPGFKNEFIKIYNPSNKSVSLSGFYFTNNPYDSKFDQNKIIFPNNAIIKEKSFLCITQKATDFQIETLEKPDFEYYENSDDKIPNMTTSEKIYFSNKQGMISLKNSYNHTIDSICYGNITKNITGWQGDTVECVDDGVIIKRNFNLDSYVDTNTSSDFKNFRLYRIGQSEKNCKIFNFTGKIQTFISPDSSYNAIVDELRKANDSIYLNIYELSSAFLCDELIKCLLRNVSVNILIEGKPVGGSSDTQKFLLKRISTYGGKIRVKFSDVENKIYPRYRFNHAKYMIVDNKSVVVESCNWGDTGVPYETSFGNREWGVIIENNSVSEYYLDVFLDDWNKNFSDTVFLEDVNWYIPYDFYLDSNYYNGFYKPSFKSDIFSSNFSVQPVFSPDTSYKAVSKLLNSAEKSIYIQQLYIYRNWTGKVNPFVKILIDKARENLDVRVIMNYNPFYDSTNKKINETKFFLEKNGVKVKLIYTNWSVFTNVHNKGVIIDNKSVLISSINWNENSFKNNREAGIIIYNSNISKYYSEVFFYDWNLKEMEKKTPILELSKNNDKNTIYIVVLFTMTFALIIQDWRKRKWT